MATLATLLLLLLSSLLLAPHCTHATTVSHDGRAITINGQRKILISGSIHYPRSTPEMWPHLIQKAKEGGLDAIETYIFWNAHEPRQREYNFEGSLDVVRFFNEVHNAGLYAVLRIGPYVCAEWNYGGIPAWLRKIPGMEFRTDNQPFKEQMQNFTTMIVEKLQKENLFAPQGGPIIISQIENEYGNIESTYGPAGVNYIKWCASLAESLNVDVPWIMCQQSDAPQPMINTCNGFYCHDFTPNNPTSPKMWTENWTGWFKQWDKADPHRRAEDIAFAVARFFQTGGTFQNYYMYHGGTNFGRSTGGPYITTTYDYDAPLDEFGNLRMPKWGHLKELHAALKSIEKPLTHGSVNTTDLGNGVSVTKYTLDATTSACFLSSMNTTEDFKVKFEGKSFDIPAWSVSIMPDCKTEAYNTAKVNTQIWHMVKKPTSVELSWSWMPENLTSPLNGLEGSLTKNVLTEQIQTAADESDYMWYITSVNIPEDENLTLYVNTTGHGLYAFVNGDLIGSHYSPNGPFNFTFEQETPLNNGTNVIALLSVTVGLQNYGAQYELMPAGIVGGPVKLTGENKTIDLSSGPWTYKFGLSGLEKEIFLDESDESEWSSDVIPTKMPFTWYKATFDAPLGKDPVVIDARGLGKGEAWVNGNSIGRYWPTRIADPGACQQCDYRGEYHDWRCRSNCGEPAQRYYHVPRSFFKAGEPNTLMLFEEAGGEPLQANFMTIAVGTTCGQLSSSRDLVLSCDGGRTLSTFEFGSFGDNQGTCASFREGFSSDDSALVGIVEKCMGQSKCSVNADAKLLKSFTTKEGEAIDSVVVQATCV